MENSQSWWSRLLRSESATARLLGMRVRTPSGQGRLSLVSVVCCHVEVSPTDRLVVHSSATESGVSNFDLETSIMSRSRPTVGCWAMKQNSEKMVSALAPSTDLMSDIFCFFLYKHVGNKIIVPKLRKSFRLDTASFLIPQNSSFRSPSHSYTKCPAIMRRRCDYVMFSHT
jgi:hypothetical protein